MRPSSPRTEGPHGTYRPGPPAVTAGRRSEQLGAQLLGRLRGEQARRHVEGGPRAVLAGGGQACGGPGVGDQHARGELGVRLLLQVVLDGLRTATIKYPDGSKDPIKGGDLVRPEKIAVYVNKHR